MVQAVNPELLSAHDKLKKRWWPRRSNVIAKEDCIFPGDTIYVPMCALLTVLVMAALIGH